MGALLLGGGLGQAASVYYVMTNGNDASSGLSWAAAKQSITNAMAAALSGGQIWVARGIYMGCITVKDGVSLYGGFVGNETTLAQRNWLTNSSVLNGGANGPVVSITLCGANTRVDGLVITNGLQTLYNGAGISISSSFAVIANNRVCCNQAPSGAGGGILIGSTNVLTGASPVVTNNDIYANQALEGAGIAVVDSSPLIAWNVIEDNTAAGYPAYGGGIGCWENCRAVIANNLIEANTAETCGGASLPPRTTPTATMSRIRLALHSLSTTSSRPAAQRQGRHLGGRHCCAGFRALGIPSDGGSHYH